MKIIWPLIILVPFVLLYANQSEYIETFPKAVDGMERFVLNLPEQQDESGLKVELIIGKYVLLDKENKYFFNGAIKEDIVKGWGFTYYKLDTLGVMAGTLMAVDPNAAKTEQFITLGGDPYLIRYNSRVPVVVYVPEGVIVKYRIWSAGLKMETMEKG
ncbi:MAG: ecotin family protein [Calditrichaceae bacterium]|nr:ecotin family protein [Calditrichaceae bacterium]